MRILTLDRPFPPLQPGTSPVATRWPWRSAAWLTRGRVYSGVPAMLDLRTTKVSLVPNAPLPRRGTELATGLGSLVLAMTAA